MVVSTDRHHVHAVLDALVDVARPVLLEVFQPDSCIASTKVGIDVLAYFGIRSEPLPLTAMVFNPEAAALLQAGTTMSDLKATMDAIPADAPGGPWSLGLGVGTQQPGSWAGHLVIALPALRTIVDLSADQASRPHKNMPLKPYHMRIDDPDWWTGDGEPVILASNEGGVLILDRRSPDPQGYRSSPNWKMTGSTSRGLYKTLTGRVIREMRARLTPT